LGFRKDALQGFQIEPLLGDFLSALILLEDGDELGGIPLCPDHPLGFIRFCGTDYLLGPAAGLGDNILLVAHGLVDETFTIFTGAHHLVERILDLLRGVDDLEL
jgi:hypothetical protein